MTEARWRHFTEIPLLAAGLVLYLVYSVSILEEGLTPRTRQACVVAQGVIWGLFIADYLVRLYLSEERRAFVRRNLLDLAATVLPLLRPLKVVALIQSVSRTHERLRVDPHRQLLVYGVPSVMLLGWAAALAVLDAERHVPGATVTSLQDALWWTLATVTTVGYGDTYPITGRGRLVGAAVMIGGIGVLGVVSASVATWFTARFQEEERARAQHGPGRLRWSGRGRGRRPGRRS
jgi:voltage-gated potassium channel